MTLAPRMRADKAHAKFPPLLTSTAPGRPPDVDRAANPRLYGVIEEFGTLTGVPVMLNTSFNRKEPIVASPEDAIAATYALTWTCWCSATST